MRTPFVRKEDVASDKHPRNWWIVDAEGKTLGRVATQIARALRGKHKAVFAPHSDVGDFVIVVNAEKIRVTGQKSMKKICCYASWVAHWPSLSLSIPIFFAHA